MQTTERTITKLSKSQIELKNRILYKYDFEFFLIKEFEKQNIEITNVEVYSSRVTFNADSFFVESNISDETISVIHDNFGNCTLIMDRYKGIDKIVKRIKSFIEEEEKA